MWLTDLFLSLPHLPLLLLIIYLFRDSLVKLVGVQIGTFLLIVAVIGGFRWMPVARLVRAQFLSLREKEFVEAARALGATRLRQVVRHILPNSLGPVIVAGTIEVATAIILEIDAVVPRPRLSARHPELGPVIVTMPRIISTSPRIGPCSRAARSFSRYSRSALSATGCATRSTRARCCEVANGERLLEIRGLKTDFATDDGIVHAVDGVDLAIDARRDVGCRRRIRLRQDRHRDDRR